MAQPTSLVQRDIAVNRMRRLSLGGDADRRNQETSLPSAKVSASALVGSAVTLLNLATVCAIAESRMCKHVVECLSADLDRDSPPPAMNEVIRTGIVFPPDRCLRGE